MLKKGWFFEYIAGQSFANKRKIKTMKNISSFFVCLPKFIQQEKEKEEDSKKNCLMMTGH